MEELVPVGYREDQWDQTELLDPSFMGFHHRARHLSGDEDQGSWGSFFSQLELQQSAEYIVSPSHWPFPSDLRGAEDFCFHGEGGVSTRRYLQYFELLILRGAQKDLFLLRFNSNSNSIQFNQITQMKSIRFKSIKSIQIQSNSI